MSNDRHVYPLNDLLPHVTEGTECPCDPKIEVIGANLLIVHNSFDGREFREEQEQEGEQREATVKETQRCPACGCLEGDIHGKGCDVIVMIDAWGWPNHKAIDAYYLGMRPDVFDRVRAWFIGWKRPQTKAMPITYISMERGQLAINEGFHYRTGFPWVRVGFYLKWKGERRGIRATLAVKSWHVEVSWFGGSVQWGRVK